MTNEEAREQIENLRAHCSDMARSAFTGGEVLWAKDVEALDQAIKALKQEPCEDCISRQAVINAIANTCFWLSADNWEELTKCINSISPTTPQPKIGHLILADEQNKEDVENDNYRFICSECQCSDIHAKGTKVPYCWNCGAKMESEGK